MNGRNDPCAYLIDSNIFLRVIVRDEERTWQDCMDILSAVEQHHIEAYIPMVVAAEIQYVLKSFYGLEKSAIVQAFTGIIATRHLRTIDDLSLSLAVKLFKDYNVKFVDCLLASSKRVQAGKAAILSYDRDFDKLGIRRVEPRDLLK
ncbi:PIN domain-containing protein [Candidatus Gottesmanbacteria bacterium]|nr:PIN domain-containing protein [Candidatus Gottesmanbacteria bacterium]